MAKERIIKVSIESGANSCSRHEHETTAEDLGFANYAAWRKATPEEKHAAVVEYWNGMGYPEIGYGEMK